MAKRKICRSLAVVLAFGMCVTALGGCGSEKSASGKTEIEVVSYKPEAVAAFEEIEKRFNETHEDIHLTISSPNEAMTILKTRFIREDYPDIIAIGGDINYSNFLDADLFEDISDLEEVSTVKPAYLEMDKELEFIPKNGTYALPYVANAAGILYNKDLQRTDGRFRQHGRSSLLYVTRSKTAERFRCILVLKIPGPVWLLGMRLR